METRKQSSKQQQEIKIRIVTPGDTLGTDTTITDLQAKQVTLEKAGQQRTLKRNPRPLLK